VIKKVIKCKKKHFKGNKKINFKKNIQLLIKIVLFYLYLHGFRIKIKATIFEKNE